MPLAVPVLTLPLRCQWHTSWMLLHWHSPWHTSWMLLHWHSQWHPWTSSRSLEAIQLFLRFRVDRAVRGGSFDNLHEQFPRSFRCDPCHSLGQSILLVAPLHGPARFGSRNILRVALELLQSLVGSSAEGAGSIGSASS